MANPFNVTIETSPSLSAYLPAGAEPRAYVSFMDVTTDLVAAPVGTLFQWRNPPFTTAWTAIALINDATGLYHADVPLHGMVGKIELQAFALDAGAHPVGSDYAQLFLTRYTA